MLNIKQESHTRENNSNNNDKRTEQDRGTNYKKWTDIIIIIIIIIIIVSFYTMYPDSTIQTPSKNKNNKLLSFDGLWKVKAKYIVLNLNALAKFGNAKGVLKS